MKEKVKNLYEVRPIPTSYTKGWCLKKHYIKRLPSIQQAYGLFLKKSGLLIGICAFGPSSNYKENEAWLPFKVLELNRLIVDDGYLKNTTSFFVSQCLKRINYPKVIVSYADIEMGHYGYVYQATNWIFTGITGENNNIYITKDGKELHQRTVDIGDGGAYRRRLYEKGIIVDVKKTGRKARYYYFCGDKRTKKEMLEKLRFPIMPYPKGKSNRYDSSHKKSFMQLF